MRGRGSQATGRYPLQWWIGFWLVAWILPGFVSLAPCPLAEAKAGSGQNKDLETAEFSQGGIGARSVQFSHQLSVGGPLSGHLVRSARFQIAPGVLGATFVGDAGTLPPADELQMSILYAETDALGAAIEPATWQTDRDPIFIWEPSAAGLELAGYSFAIDEAPDATVETSGTSFDVATQLPQPLADGIHTFAVRAVNTAGVAGDPISFALWVDTTPPSITAYAPTPGALLNTAAPATTATVVDPHSGVDQTTIPWLLNGAQMLVTFDPASQTLVMHSTGVYREGPNNLELQVRDAVGNAAAPLLWSVTVDTVPPVGILAINGGAAITTSLYVTLGLSATDDTSGVVAMRLSNEAFGGYVQEPYATLRELWALHGVPGVQSVYVKFVDAAGNESQPVADQIELSLLSPETVIVGGPSGITSESAATFTFMCPQGGCVFSYAFDNAEWSDWAPATQALIAGLTHGNHYFRVRAAKDINGVMGIQPDEEDASPAERTWIVIGEDVPLMIPFGPPVKLWRIE